MARLRVLLVLLGCLAALGTPSAAQGASVIHWSIEGVSDVQSLDPAKATDAQAFTVAHFLHAGLVRLDARLRVVPDLAEFWFISPDGLTYTFELRRDARFSDGSAVTAEDVKWSLTHALDPNTGAWTGGFLLSNIEGADALLAGETDTLSGVTVVNDYTVDIRIKWPSAYFLSQLTFGPARITSKAAAEADPQGWELAPISSGAFMVQEWRRGAGMTLVPNPHYWQPATVTVNIVFNPDSDAAFQQFLDGAVDIVGSTQNPIPFDRVAEVENSPAFRTTNAFNLRYVGFNTQLPPFDDVRVRRAFAMATDRNRLANEFLDSTVVATDRLMPFGIPGSELIVTGVPFDPAMAAQLLAEAGLDPADFAVTLTFGREGVNQQVVEALKVMWEENLGIRVTIQGLPLNEFSARLNETYQNPAQGLQMYYSIWNSIYPDPQYFISQILRSGGGQQQRTLFQRSI